ncbi:MAG: amino acid permease, partial [Gemmatimonadota bacterium]
MNRQTDGRAPESLSSTPEDTTDTPKLFGTFGGVFTPTLLTSLGVIMYLRLPWVVGNAGLVGAFLVVGLAIGITAATGLSLSSIATNTRIGTGGPYAIISKALGYEIGGSVGLPLYLSQALAVAMYIFGFREGWLWVFPTHPALLVDLGIFVVILTIAYLSADLAFRVQYLVLAVIGLSLVAILGNVSIWQSPLEIAAFGDYPGSPEDGFSGTGYWGVFAVFFPAATGILAGANMSGELRNPRVSIPSGTLGAIAVSSVIYLALAVWAAKAAPPEDLVSNYTIMIDRSLWGPIVVAGLLGATFSSALTSLVGAPRILRALGRDRLLPAGTWVAKTSKGEPRRAMIVTGSIVLLALMTRDLNVIAPLITMFFLITYAVINIVMLAEASLGLMSFRPTLEVPRIVPLLGALGCIFAMFIVNPTFSLVAVAVVIGIYLWILWQGSTPRTGTVRSGIFVAFAEWAAGKVMELELSSSRAWKPSLLVPVRDPTTLRGEFRLLVDLTFPEGSIKVLGIATHETVEDLSPRVRDLTRYFRKRGVMAT